MKKTLTILAVLALTGCASAQSYKAPMQNYNDISITGELIYNKEVIKKNSGTVNVFFNGKKQIEVPLNVALRGDNLGADFDGKKTSASCTSQLVTREVATVDCVIYIDQKRTVTLTF